MPATVTAAVIRGSTPGEFDRDIPDIGVNSAVWNGGTVMELSSAVAAAGGISVTVFVGGEAKVLIPGAPVFVNAAFNAAFPSGTVPAGTEVASPMTTTSRPVCSRFSSASVRSRPFR